MGFYRLIKSSFRYQVKSNADHFESEILESSNTLERIKKNSVLVLKQKWIFKFLMKRLYGE